MKYYTARETILREFTVSKWKAGRFMLTTDRGEKLYMMLPPGPDKDRLASEIAEGRTPTITLLIGIAQEEEDEE